MNPATTHDLALWLIQHMDRVRRHEAAGDMVTEVRAAVTRAVAVINRPAPRVYAGPCGECGMDLITQAGRNLVTCAMCHATYGIAERQDWMRAQLHDYLVTATEAADEWLPAIGIRVADGTIRMWAHRHRLEKWPGIPRWPGDEDAPPRYRVGDIAALAMARDTTRAGLRVLPLRTDLLLRHDSYHLTRGGSCHPCDLEPLGNRSPHRAHRQRHQREG
jgi:hypothetical protein